MKQKTRKTPLLTMAIAGMLLCAHGGAASAADVPKVGTAGQAGLPGQATSTVNRPAVATSPQAVLPQKGPMAPQPGQPLSPRPMVNPAMQPNRPGANPSPNLNVNQNQNNAQMPKSASKPPVIVVAGGGIDADIKGPLSETLRAMADKKLFDIRGPMPAGEEITVQFSGLTLDEALKKLMRGYNYVLMEGGNSQKPVLVLLGRIQRSAQSAQMPQPVQPVPMGQPGSPSYAPPTTGPAGAQARTNNRRFPATAEGQPGAVPPAVSAAGSAPQGPQVKGQPGSQPGVAEPTRVAPGEGQSQQASGQPGQQQVGQQQAQTPQPGRPQAGQDGTSGASAKDLLNNQVPKSEPNVGVKF